MFSARIFLAMAASLALGAPACAQTPNFTGKTITGALLGGSPHAGMDALLAAADAVAAGVETVLRDDPDEVLSMLADLVGATDRQLRDLARRLAGRLFLDLASRGRSRRGGVCGGGARRCERRLRREDRDGSRALAGLPRDGG